MVRILSLCMAAAMLIGCASLPTLSNTLDMGFVADQIGVEPDVSGQLEPDDRLLVTATALLAVTEVASHRDLDRFEARSLADLLEANALALLSASDGDGWFVEQDAQEALNAAAMVVGESALRRGLDIALSGPSVDGAISLATTAGISRNVAAGVRRLRAAYEADRISRAQLIEILRGRFAMALGRLRGVEP